MASFMKVMPRRFRRPFAFAVAVGLGTLPARAYQVFVDFNTYSKSLENSALSTGQYTAGTDAVSATSAFAGADGVWLIEQNSGGIATSASSGFTLSDWRSMITNTAGAGAWVSTEDNPPQTTSSNGVYTVNNQNTSFVSTQQIVGVTGYGTGTTGFTYLDAMSYNETGSLTGGTLLSPSQINGTSGNGTSANPYNVGEAATHGGAITVLTRGYGTDSNNNGITFQGATNTDLALSNVPAAVMETTSFDGENVIGFVNATYAAGKRAYIYLQAGYEDSRLIPAMYNLKQLAPAATASGLVNIIVDNDYNTTNAANAYGWYGGDGSVQDATAFEVAFKNAVPVTSYVWNRASSGTISATGNWSPQYQFSYFNNKAAIAADTANTSYPSHTYDAINFTNSTYAGNITATIDTSSVEALGIYFAGAANYTLASSSAATNVLHLTGYGTLGASGNVGDGVNIIPIQVTGTGANSITAPVTLLNANAAGLTIDQQDTAGALTMSGTLTTAGLPIVVQGAGTTILSGAIGGSSALTKQGSGILTLGGTGANSAVSASVSAGTLQLNASGSGVAAGGISDIAAGAVVKVTGTSTSQLNPSYSGANLTINSGGTFDLNGNTLGVTALSGTSGYVTSTVVASSTLTTGLNAQSGTFGGTLQDGAGTLSVVKSGIGAQTLAGSNNYSGTTVISAGELDFTGVSSLPANSGTITVNSGATVELDAPNGSNLTLAMPMSLSGAGASGDRGALFLNNGKITTYTLTGGISITGATTIGSYGVTQNLNLNGAITGSGSLLFNDEGGSVSSHTFNVAFSAASSYTGVTTLESGNADSANFKVGTTNALPASTVLYMNAGGGSLTLNVNGQAQAIAGLVSAGTASHDFVTSSGGTLTINSAGSYSYGGQINGTVGVVKSGAGVQTLSGTNGYTGTTAVSGGTLLITGALAKTATAVGAGGTLGGTGSIAGAVTSSGTIAPGIASGTAGSLSLNGGLTLSSTSSLAFTLGTAAGNSKILTTALTLNPVLQCVVAPGSSFAVGQYPLIDYSGTLTDNSLNFTGWTLVGLPATAQYHFELATDQTTGSGPYEPAVVLDVTVVPEPDLAVGAVMMLGLIARRRRRSSIRIIHRSV